MHEENLFHRALQLPPNERAAFLDRECPADAGLRQRLEILLHAHENPGSFLRPPVPSPQATVDHAISERPGTVIGLYKLMEQIGEGGMGLVFVAEQQEPVRRKVALKVIKPGMDTREVIARFEAERQALALMDHPNIARVLDAGATESGRPYFVMELVKGVPITDYCDQQQLTPRERLELFIPVCQAVQHAHTKGVIHRDLKPSNILIAPHDGKPVVKVIDFGVAKAIGQPLTDKTIYTRVAQMIGTPLYMSPEQAELNALDVDTRSDVYALGVLLYELLTGTTPFDRQRFGTAAFDEIRRIIREEEPPKPSTRLSTLGESLSAVSAKRKTEPGKMAALVKGDLDWIVMKALEKDRTCRYETASALAADVHRYLDEQPIEARPPSSWYRFRKMVRRNKVAVTTTAVVAAALVLGIIGTTLGWVHALDAQAEALAARDHEARQRLEALDQKNRAARNEQRALKSEREALASAERAKKSEEAAKDSAKKEAASAAWATEQEKIAREQAKIADQERQKAQKNEYQAQMGLYAANLVSAQRHLEANNVRGFYQYFEKCSPELRGWEHDFLYTQVNANEQTLRGHDQVITRVAYSPDGKRLATAAGDSKVMLWDVATGTVVLTFNGHTMAFSSDGKRLATCTFLKEAAVWNTVTREKIWSLTEAPGGKIGLSPDGKLVAVAGGDYGKGANKNYGFVQLWDVATPKKVLLDLREFKSRVFDVAFHPDGRRLAIALEDGTVRLLELASGKEYLTLKGHSDMVGNVAFSRDGKRLATASRDKTVKLWDAASGKELLSINTTNTQRNAALSPDGKLLASVSEDAVKVWETASGQEVASFKGHTAPARYVAFSPDGKRLASASGLTLGSKKPKVIGEVRIWELAAQEKALKFQWSLQRRLERLKELTKDKAFKWKENPDLITVEKDIVFSPHGKSVAAGLADKTARIWDLASGKETAALQGHTEVVFGVAFSPDSKLLATASGDRTAKIWNAASGQPLRTFTGHTDRILDVAFSPDGKRLATASIDGTVKVWDADGGPALLTLMHPDPVETVVFSPHGKYLATTSEDQKKFSIRTVKIWDAATGLEILTVAGCHGTAWAFSPDGKRLVSECEEKTVKVWDTATGAVVLTFKEHTDYVTGVAFSPDGKYVASACQDRTVKFWDPDSGEVALSLKHLGMVFSLAFSPDGKRLATSARLMGEVKLWDTRSGQELLALKHPDTVEALAFSPDGKRLAAKSWGGFQPGGTITIWDASKSMKDADK
jgi:WD40 repeat protein/serine/threonine protein kinase